MTWSWGLGDCDLDIKGHSQWLPIQRPFSTAKTGEKIEAVLYRDGQMRVAMRMELVNFVPED